MKTSSTLVAHILVDPHKKSDKYYPYNPKYARKAGRKLGQPAWKQVGHHGQSKPGQGKASSTSHSNLPRDTVQKMTITLCPRGVS